MLVKQSCIWSASVLARCATKYSVTASRSVCTSQIHNAGSKWRLQHGLGKCGNEYGPLTEIPDWSYADGRPAPLQDREVKRRLKMTELAKKAVRYIDEMKEAKKQYAEKTKSRH